MIGCTKKTENGEHYLNFQSYIKKQFPNANTDDLLQDFSHRLEILKDRILKKEHWNEKIGKFILLVNYFGRDIDLILNFLFVFIIKAFWLPDLKLFIGHMYGGNES